jgi:hypothetical protein
VGYSHHQLRWRVINSMGGAFVSAPFPLETKAQCLAGASLTSERRTEGLPRRTPRRCTAVEDVYSNNYTMTSKSLRNGFFCSSKMRSLRCRSS